MDIELLKLQGKLKPRTNEETKQYIKDNQEIYDAMLSYARAKFHLDFLIAENKRHNLGEGKCYVC